jgi:hypothetical protein
MNNLKRPKQIVCILGMHRSGTSALTGSLQKCGLELGKHHTWNPHNKRGNRENQDIVDLHDAILNANNGAWDNPPKLAPWDNTHIERAKELLAEYAEIPCWGFKDPRALIALDQWKILIPDIKFVGIFRHPMAVATSLNKRGNMPIKQGLELWYQYNCRLLEEKKNNAFPLLCFDWSEQELHDKLNTVANELGLGDISQDDKFYTQDLHHHSFSGSKGLPWKVRWLYRKLQKQTSH